MIAATLPTTLNWYDYAVATAVLLGFYTGLRAGLTRSLLRTVMWVLMTFLALLLYPTMGNGLHDIFDVEADSANLQAFLLVGLVVYIPCHFASNEIMFRTSKYGLPAWLDNAGGVLFGAVVMVVVMAWLSIALALMRSPLWHEQVARNSCFGARVVQQFPSVAAMAEKQQQESLWFMKPIPRREEPTADGYKKQR